MIDALQAVRIADPERVARLLSVPAQRRHAAARRDRGGGGAQAGARSSPTSRRRRSTRPCNSRSCGCSTNCRRALRTGLILISHDLAVIASVCSRVYVMYAAQIVESRADARHLPRARRIPTRKALLGSILDPLEEASQLTMITGSHARSRRRRTGCRFHPRCPHGHADLPRAGAAGVRDRRRAHGQMLAPRSKPRRPP